MADSASTAHLSYLHSFPDPLNSLNFALEPLVKCLDEGLVVLDANVLLLPFKTGPHALDEIEKAFESLKAQNRLFVPKHALREYLANRPNKIKEFYDQLTKKRNKDYNSPATSRIIEKSTAYPELAAAEKELKDQIDKLSRLVGSVIDEVKQWQTNDPVSQVYKRLLSPEMILDDPADRGGLEKEHQERILKGIPPGYKDGAKEKNNIGDFLIWKTILSLGGMHKGKHLIFVSGEEKADWVYRSANETLYAREELIEEYRKASEGGSFHLIDLAALLRYLKASDKAVAEVRANEAVSGDSGVGLGSSQQNAMRWSEFVEFSEQAAGAWLSDLFSPANVLFQAGDTPFDFIVFDKDVEIFVEVRPIRHYEHFMNRVWETTRKLTSAVEAGPLNDPSKHATGLIVFVCENVDGAYFIAQASKGMKHPSWLSVQAGYLENGKFIPLD